MIYEIKDFKFIEKLICYQMVLIIEKEIENKWYELILIGFALFGVLGTCLKTSSASWIVFCVKW